MDVPFSIEAGAPGGNPVVVAVPHAGRIYTPALLAAARVSEAVLSGLEDRLADRIAEGARAMGATLIVARLARAMLDLNRDPREIDPEMIAGPITIDPLPPTPKLRAGLGLFPRRLPHAGELWRGRLAADEALGRIATIHTPYHHAIAEALGAARTQFGAALLLDCHSMPALPASYGRMTPRIVVGDLHGAAADIGLIELVMETIGETGLPAIRNAPYAGGHALRRHANPRGGIHAIQIEFDRTLYLDGAGAIIPQGLAECRALFGEITARLADRLRDAALPMAAE
ncbi:N-formylglutamate amidohydrolase [Sphingomonas montanisoli]|uniref:N-formylglutamate amidohydrolase n=1 Tax=Sphingomonas montanisoli TaxID=2606412 RepID=A0A5D9CBH6_9SPHN|nr:N-formylglutamate amidohydrolase [Sphingomonas montanisoli]TZG29308.1 N-formylglutamate amidohydrolase [Sphingomonas montanisoli]